MSQAPPPPSMPPPASSPPPPAGTYPVQIGFDRGLDVDRWRPIVNWILAIPHLFIAYILILMERVLGIVCFFTILFTKQVPEPIFTFRVMAYRYFWRALTYAGFMRNEYPPFSFETVAVDDGIDAASVTMYQPAEYNRWAPLYKWFIAIPHYLVLVVLEIGAIIAWFIAFFAVIITGQYPQALRDFHVGVFRWFFRVDAYVYLMDDVYPPFSLQ